MSTAKRVDEGTQKENDKAAAPEQQKAAEQVDSASAAKWQGVTTATELDEKMSGAEGVSETGSFNTIRQGLRLSYYVWKPKTDVLRGVVVVVHGVTSHCRFDWLFHKPVFDNPASGKSGNYGDRRELVYESSWVEKLNSLGYAVYGLDLQGHGASQGWENHRCNMREFDDFAVDVLQFMYIVNDRVNESNPSGNSSSNASEKSSHSAFPLFLMGLSLGGCTVIRTTEILEDDLRASLAGKDSKELILPFTEPSVLSRNFRGCIPVAPMLCLDSIMAKPLNRALSIVSAVAFRYAPNMQAVALQTNPKFPHLDDDRAADPLCWNNRIPVRMAVLNRDIMVPCLENAKKIGQPLDDSEKSTSVVSGDTTGTRPPPPSFLAVHSRDDTMCDHTGSEKLINNLIFVEDKTLHLIDELWHCLSTEPGNEPVLQVVCDWIVARTGKSPLKHQPVAETGAKNHDSLSGELAKDKPEATAV